MNTTKRPAPARPITADAVRRIQSSTAKKNDGRVPAGSFCARAQRTVARKK